jgi:hypothetical protein
VTDGGIMLEVGVIMFVAILIGTIFNMRMKSGDAAE